jgi:uncharacterized protein DUF4394
MRQANQARKSNAPPSRAQVRHGRMRMSESSLRRLCIEPLENRLALATLYGLNLAGDGLVRFDSATPGTLDFAVSITGLNVGESVKAIDFRPTTGQLYGLGVLGATASLLTINPITGVATHVGAPFAVTGSNFGVDFNPTVDRLRVVSDTDQNLRINPNDGTPIIDLALAYDNTTADGDPIDPNAGANPNVAGVAYTNNFSGATTTTLFDIDSNLDILAIQNPPNGGVLNTVGPLGVNTDDGVGFDIASDGTAFATLTVGGFSQLYTINTTTGAATLVGQISPAMIRITGLAVAPSIATVVNGKLTVEGSGDDDIVTITGVGAGTGVYVVTKQQGGGPVQTQTVTGVTTDISVFLHAGNDQLTMNNVFINGSIIVEMDTGNDTVTLGHADVVSTKGDLDIDLGTDNDALNGRRIFIGGDQNLLGGDGNDTMTFDGFASPFTLGTSAAGNANWFTGSGNDHVNVVYAFVGGAWGIDLAAGTDSLNIFGSSSSGNMSAVGAAGDDILTIDTNFFDAAIFLDGGAENDTVLLANNLGSELSAINTGAGSDTITVRNQSASLLVIDSGAGNDTVETRSSAFDRFFAIMGDEDDQLTLFGNLFRFEMDLDGGNGIVDRLLNLGNDTRGAARARNFELFG